MNAFLEKGILERARLLAVPQGKHIRLDGADFPAEICSAQKSLTTALSGMAKAMPFQAGINAGASTQVARHRLV